MFNNKKIQTLLASASVLVPIGVVLSCYSTQLNHSSHKNIIENAYTQAFSQNIVTLI